MSTVTHDQPATEAEQSELAAAVAELDDLRARAARAEATRDAHRLEAEQLEASAGADLLDSEDPDAGDRLAARLGQLRASVELQDRAAREAHARAAKAAAAALKVEAGLLGPIIAEAARQLSVFDSKSERLVEAVKKHTGLEVTLVHPSVAFREQFEHGQVTRAEWLRPPRDVLADEVSALQLRRDLTLALAAVAAGERDLAGVRDEFGAYDARTAEWEDLPQLVRDSVVEVGPLWLQPPTPPRDWAAEVEAMDADIVAAEERLTDLERRRASQDRGVRNAAIAEDYFAVSQTPGGLRHLRSQLVAQAARAGVSVG